MEHSTHGASTPPTARILAPPQWKGACPRGFFARLASEPAILDAVRGLCDTLPKVMARRTLELVALRVSAQLGCVYVWQGHCHIALGADLTFTEIAGVAHGPAAFGATPDAVVLRAVDELLAHDCLSIATRAELGDAELAVTVAIATYRLVSSLMDGFEPEPGIAPVTGLETPARARATHHRLLRADCVRSDQPEAA